LPLGPAYVSDENSPSPVTLAIYVTLTTVPLPSVNSVGPIDRGGLQFVRPPGPLLLDPHPTATTASATAAMLRRTFARFIKREARVMRRRTNSGANLQNDTARVNRTRQWYHSRRARRYRHTSTTFVCPEPAVGPPPIV
jgi:hypothetical protein